MPEIWRAVCCAPYYEVSNRGRVRSQFKIIASQDKGKYRVVHLQHNKRRIVRYVHTLVAAAFIGPRPKGHEVDHIDFDPSNNNEENLQYLSRQSNLNRSARVGHFKPPRIVGEQQWEAKLTERDVRQIRRIYARGKVFQRQLADVYRVTQTTISAVTRGYRWRHVR